MIWLWWLYGMTLLGTLRVYWTATVAPRLPSRQGSRFRWNKPISGRFPSWRRSRCGVDDIRCGRWHIVHQLRVFWSTSVKLLGLCHLEFKSTIQWFHHPFHHRWSCRSAYSSSARIFHAVRPDYPLRCSTGNNREVGNANCLEVSCDVSMMLWISTWTTKRCLHKSVI